MKNKHSPVSTDLQIDNNNILSLQKNAVRPVWTYRITEIKLNSRNGYFSPI